MNASDLCFVPAGSLAHLIARRQVTAVEVTQAFLSRISAWNPALNAFTTVLADQALVAADALDARLARGEDPGPLAGVPVAIKDLIDVASVATTRGAHERFWTMPNDDAPVVARLRAAGAVVIGKTGLHEFAYGVTNLNPHFGPVRNPWDLTRIPGGSSGGSAAAVAAGLCAAAVGTDTGGSIRIPAALCGTVGLKPTYGLVPCGRVVPLAWTLDHVGPLTRSVEDAAQVLYAMVGMDAPPASGRRAVPPLETHLAAEVGGLRIGVPRTFFWERLDADVRELAEAAVQVLEGAGAVIVEVEIPHAASYADAVAVIIAAEATAIHEQRVRAHPEYFGEDLRRRLERGFFVPATDYLLAQRARRFLTAEFLTAVAAVDVLVMPTTVTAALPIEEAADRGPTMSLAASRVLTRCTNPFNLTGFPALSVPCGFTAAGLPAGLQIVGRPFDEGMLLRVGLAYERATEWHMRRPILREGHGVPTVTDTGSRPL